MLCQTDVTILGAGVIGLSLALELHRRGVKVTLYEPRAAAAQASWAAAGMLANQDPHNPAPLRSLANLSAALYPAFLEDLGEHSGLAVPFQTDRTFQLFDGKRVVLREHSIDPRQLAMALVTAVQRAGIPVTSRTRPPQTLQSRTEDPIVVHATGAWAEAPEIAPRKGQMLRVQLPSGSALRAVHRSDCVYVVPRTQGPQAGTALIGATVEDAGFDTSTCADDLNALRGLAAALVPEHPELGDGRATPTVEAWAGLRPGTPDGLPLLGPLPSPGQLSSRARQFIAAGHFRNGILLAPATAVLMADLIEGRNPAVDLSPFAPGRFTQPATGTPGSGHG